MRRWDLIGRAYARRLARLPTLNQYDLVWIEKEALPGLPWALEKLFYGRVPTLVDYDDLWIARFDAPGTAVETHKNCQILQAATGVTAANDELADALARLCQRRPDVLISAIDVDGKRPPGTTAVEGWPLARSA